MIQTTKFEIRSPKADLDILSPGVAGVVDTWAHFRDTGLRPVPGAPSVSGSIAFHSDAPRTGRRPVSRVRQSARAFTLTELLFIISIIGVASYLSMHLFVASMKVVASAPVSQEQSQIVDQMCAAMRNDVWGATKIDVADAGRITITLPDRGTVEWAVEPDALMRTSAGESRRWKVGIPLTARIDASGLVLSAESGDQARFVSQVIWAEGRP